eukprot:gene24959-31360_t
MRKLKLKAGPKIVTTNTKVDRREVGKERKALKAAQLDRAIEAELLERLKNVTESEIYNYPERSFAKTINRVSNKFHEATGTQKSTADEDSELEDEDELTEEGSYEEGEMEMEEEEEDEEEDGEYHTEYIEDFEESDGEDDESDIEDSGDKVYSNYYSKDSSKGASSKPGADKKRKPEAMSSSSKKLKQQLDEANFNKTRNAALANNRSHVEVEYEVEDEYENEAPVAAERERGSSHGHKKSKKSTPADYNF